MCKDAKITTEQLTKAMDAEYQKLVQQVKDVVNLAPDGAVISGSEELVREAMARFRQKAYSGFPPLGRTKRVDGGKIRAHRE